MGSSTNSFKWFGEGFNGFPKRIPEACVEYSLHIFDPKLKDPEIRDRLRTIRNAGSVLTKDLLHDHIWQREEFGLEIAREDGDSFLLGTTDFGDSVEDEWLVVYLLRELSKNFPDVWIKVVDTDGEFLLIEGANALPPWMNPEIADNRVWMNSGKLLLIPRASRDQSVARSLTKQEARTYIQINRDRILHLPELEKEAFYRLRGYPQQISRNSHHALAIIPRKVAYLLSKRSAYMSPAIEAFYLRDPIALRTLKVKRSSQLVFPAVDMVTTVLKFTKVGYAQIKNQQCSSSLSWTYELPPNSTPISQSQMETGIKVTAGFEMLLADAQYQDRRLVREIKLLLEDLDEGIEHLPSDAHLTDRNLQEEDESWLDIDYEEFEEELVGKGGKATAGRSKGFGDQVAQENLRKIVGRFEDFLKDDSAGMEGAEFLDEMDKDDDEEDDNDNRSNLKDDSPISNSDEDEDINFDSDCFTQMMRELVGISAEGNLKTSREDNGDDRLQSATDTGLVYQDNREEDEEELGSLMRDMEFELREAGALDVNPVPSVDTRIKKFSSDKHDADSDRETDDESPNAEEVSIDYGAARNLLESFKSQGGMAGPGSNIMSSLGLSLPRDEDNIQPGLRIVRENN